MLVALALQVTRYLFYLAQRKSSLLIEELPVSDTRPRVLLLRSFSMDENKETGNRRNMSIEEFIGAPIIREVGPFIALGNPDDYLPTTGAIKSYRPHNDWKSYVTQRVAEAGCVVVLEGATESLGWELRLLRENMERGRVFIQRIPIGYESWEEQQMSSQDLQLMADARWRQFCFVLRNAGWNVSPDSDPPPAGSFLACTENWELVPVEGWSLASALAHILPGACKLDETHSAYEFWDHHIKSMGEPEMIDIQTWHVVGIFCMVAAIYALFRLV